MYLSPSDLEEKKLAYARDTELMKIRHEQLMAEVAQAHERVMAENSRGHEISMQERGVNPQEDLGAKIQELIETVKHQGDRIEALVNSLNDRGVI